VALGAALPLLRAWDRSRARAVDRFIGISAASKAAIRQYYGRDADVMFSPILSLPEVFEPHPKGDFFLLVSRLEPWKNIEVVVDAFRSLETRLVIVGDGPERGALQGRAGPNVEFAGAVGEAELVSLYRRARAVIHSARTEYGLTPIEANAYGTPAICWGVAGALETMVSYALDPDNATALFYDESTPAAIADAVRRFETIRFDPARCHANARRFGRNEFVSRIQAYVRTHA
jgi:glycosyltransferase involved in cell wall biosynthesis